MGDRSKTISVIANSVYDHDGMVDEVQGLADSCSEKGFGFVFPGNLDGIKGAFAARVLSSSMVGNTKIANVVVDPALLCREMPPLSEVDRDVRNGHSFVIVGGEQNLKDSLVNRSDIALLLPGGGIDELSQAVHLARMGAPLVVVNTEGYYSGLREQVERIQDNEYAHTLYANETAHIHFANDVNHAAALVEAYGNAGTPQHDYMLRRQIALRDEKILQHSRDEHITGFKSVGNVHILASETGLVALDRAVAELAWDNAKPLVIDNTDGYNNGLIGQLETMVEYGVVTKRFYDRYVIAKDTAHALAVAKDIADQTDFCPDF